MPEAMAGRTLDLYPRDGVPDGMDVRPPRHGGRASRRCDDRRDRRWVVDVRRQSRPTARSTPTSCTCSAAPGPLGPWQPHPANPVVSDVRSARPAGRPVPSRRGVVPTQPGLQSTLRSGDRPVPHRTPRPRRLRGTGRRAYRTRVDAGRSGDAHREPGRPLRPARCVDPGSPDLAALIPRRPGPAGTGPAPDRYQKAIGESRCQQAHWDQASRVSTLVAACPREPRPSGTHEIAHPSRGGAAKPRGSRSQPGCRMEFESMVWDGTRWVSETPTPLSPKAKVRSTPRLARDRRHDPRDRRHRRPVRGRRRRCGQPDRIAVVRQGRRSDLDRPADGSPPRSTIQLTWDGSADRHAEGPGDVRADGSTCRVTVPASRPGRTPSPRWSSTSDGVRRRTVAGLRAPPATDPTPTLATDDLLGRQRRGRRVAPAPRAIGRSTPPPARGRPPRRRPGRDPVPADSDGPTPVATGAAPAPTGAPTPVPDPPIGAPVAPNPHAASHGKPTPNPTPKPTADPTPDPTPKPTPKPTPTPAPAGSVVEFTGDSSGEHRRVLGDHQLPEQQQGQDRRVQGRRATYRVDSRVQVSGWTGRIVGRDATFRRYATNSGRDAILRIVGGNDVRIENLNVRGPATLSNVSNWSSWAREEEHALYIDSGTDITVVGGSFTNTWGDGIYHRRTRQFVVRHPQRHRPRRRRPRHQWPQWREPS